MKLKRGMECTYRPNAVDTISPPLSKLKEETQVTVVDISGRMVWVRSGSTVSIVSPDSLIPINPRPTRRGH